VRRETDAFKRLIEAKATMLVPTPNHAVGLGGGGGASATTALSTSATGGAARGQPSSSSSSKEKIALAMDTRTVHWNAVGGGVKVGDNQALTTTTGGSGSGSSGGSDENKRRVIVDVREFRSSLPSFLHGSGLHIDACTLLVSSHIRTYMLDLYHPFCYPFSFARFLRSCALYLPQL